MDGYNDFHVAFVVAPVSLCAFAAGFAWPSVWSYILLAFVLWVIFTLIKDGWEMRKLDQRERKKNADRT